MQTQLRSGPALSLTAQMCQSTHNTPSQPTSAKKLPKKSPRCAKPPPAHTPTTPTHPPQYKMADWRQQAMSLCLVTPLCQILEYQYDGFPDLNPGHCFRTNPLPFHLQQKPACLHVQPHTKSPREAHREYKKTKRQRKSDEQPAAVGEGAANPILRSSPPLSSGLSFARAGSLKTRPQ